LVVF
jgi:hypothetical protein